MNQQSSMIKPEQCPGYEGCKAPICPLSNTFQKATWFNGESICQARAYRRERWRISQRRIERNAKDRETCFTVAMLSAVRQVRGGMVGLPPEDVIDTERVKAWIRQRSGCASLNEKGSESAINKNLKPPGPMVKASQKELFLIGG